MVVKEDGTKWACASCLKGHRVSGCTHVERELTFVPKKGRPITQCPHCRAERKRRSAHIKCDCGDKTHSKEKCIHLREAEAAAAAGIVPATACSKSTVPNPALEQHASHSDLVTLVEESPKEEDSCCCPHGGDCTCSTRRNPEDGHDCGPNPKHDKPYAYKPRLTSHQSEGHLTVFANGHHKPVHRNNHAAHECGVPYKLPRSHTSHGVPSIARRSVDSLASVQSSSPVTWHQQSASTSVSPPLQEAPVQSERASPQSEFSIGTQQTFGPRMSIDSASYSVPEPSSSVASVPNTVFQDFGFPSATSTSSITTTSTEPAMSAYSMPTSALDFGNGAPDFWANLDWNRIEAGNIETQPALTNASSGTISEIDDLPRVDDLSAFDPQYSIDGQSQMPQLGLSDFAEGSNYGANFNVNSNSYGSSNRWSMPAFSSLGNNPMFTALSTGSPAKDMPGQKAESTQVTLQNQSGIPSGESSAQSHSPVADNMYQDKSGDMSNFDWGQLLSNYDTNVVPSNDGSMLAVSESGQNSGVNTQTSNLPPTGSYNGIDIGFRTMQWDDGVSIPADQSYVDNYNFDPTWPAGNSFDPWS